MNLSQKVGQDVSGVIAKEARLVYDCLDFLFRFNFLIVIQYSQLLDGHFTIDYK